MGYLLKNKRRGRKIINHHIVEGTRESHPRVHDLQHPRLGKPRRGLQIMDTRMGFPFPFHSVVIDSISLRTESDLILYQILHSSLQKNCMERSACHKMFSKWQNVNILIISHVARRRFLTVLVDTYVPETVPRRYAKFAVRNLSRLDVIWMKRSSSGVSFFLLARSRAVYSKLSLHETIFYSVSNCFMNIKMNINTINVEIWLFLPNCARFPLNICNGCGMQTEDAYSSEHLVLSQFGTCICSNVEANLSWTCLVSGLLNFEHPSVLLFCFQWSWEQRWSSG